MWELLAWSNELLGSLKKHCASFVCDNCANYPSSYVHAATMTSNYCVASMCNIPSTIISIEIRLKPASWSKLIANSALITLHMNSLYCDHIYYYSIHTCHENRILEYNVPYSWYNIIYINTCYWSCTKSRVFWRHIALS